MKAGGVPGREKEKNSVKERETSDYSATSREHVTKEFQFKIVAVKAYHSRLYRIRFKCGS